MRDTCCCDTSKSLAITIGSTAPALSFCFGIRFSFSRRVIRALGPKTGLFGPQKIITFPLDKTQALWYTVLKIKQGGHTMTNLIETGKQIAANKSYSLETAAILNGKLEAIMGRKNPLGLNDIGHAPMGRDLNEYISQTVINIGNMQARAEVAGRVTPQALEMVAKVLDAINATAK
jgi:hypothetical protein